MLLEMGIFWPMVVSSEFRTYKSRQISKYICINMYVYIYNTPICMYMYLYLSSINLSIYHHLSLSLSCIYNRSVFFFYQFFEGIHLIKSTGKILCEIFQCFHALFNKIFNTYYQIIYKILTPSNGIPHLSYELFNILLF